MAETCTVRRSYCGPADAVASLRFPPFSAPPQPQLGLFVNFVSWHSPAGGESSGEFADQTKAAEVATPVHGLFAVLATAKASRQNHWH